MLEKKTLFDTIFSDMLAEPGTAGYVYLLECFTSYLEQKDKAVNNHPQIQELIHFLKEMTMNYASLLATNPDLYPFTLPLNEDLEGTKLSAFRITHLLETQGYVQAFMTELNQQIKAMDKEAFIEIYTYIFTTMRA